MTAIEEQLFNNDYYVKLHNNLNRIKQLQLFTIDQYYVDFIGNQWFLYKPRYENFLKTDDSEVDFENIKNGIEIKNNKNNYGEIWLRLKNYPFAYPLIYNTKCRIKDRLWRNLLNGEILKINIYENLGCIYYYESGLYNLLLFKIEQEYLKTEERVEIKAKNNEYSGEETKELITLNKQVLITPIKTYKFKSTDKFIDCIVFNGNFYCFYYDESLFETNSIKMKKLEFDDSAIIIDYINYTSIIKLPNYIMNGQNICSPTSEGNWVISIAENNINVAYEAIPD